MVSSHVGLKASLSVLSGKSKVYVYFFAASDTHRIGKQIQHVVPIALGGHGARAVPGGDDRAGTAV